MRNRKLISLLVTAANNTIAKSLAGGRLTPGFKPGIVSLIQTHSGSLDWNCHLHMVVTDGAVDTSSLFPILKLGAVEFLAKLTLHIPDRYQNIRRYAGFYASIVQCVVKKAAAAGNTLLPPVHETKSVRPNWAALISKIFGALPIACPKCGAIMELKEFILNEKPITRMFPDAARAPPTLTFDRYLPPEGGIVYGHAEDDTETGAQFCQLPKDDDAFFNQENSW